MLWDLFELSKESLNDWYPVYNKAKLRNKHKDCAVDDQPEWHTVWTECGRQTHIAFERLGELPKSRDIMNTFWLESRRKFRLLEMLDRAAKRLDRIAVPVKRSVVSESVTEPKIKRRKAETRLQKLNPAISVSQKRSDIGLGMSSCSRQKRLKFQSIFSCEAAPPVRCGRRSLKRCRLCGYAVKTKLYVKLSCCDKIAHIECWRLKSAPGRFLCAEITGYVKKC